MKQKQKPKRSLIFPLIFGVNFALLILGFALGATLSWWALFAVVVIFLAELIYYNFRFNLNAVKENREKTITMQRFNNEASLTRDEQELVVTNPLEENKKWQKFTKEYAVTQPDEARELTLTIGDQSVKAIACRLAHKNQSSPVDGIFFNDVKMDKAVLNEFLVTSVYQYAFFANSEVKAYGLEIKKMREKPIDPDVNFSDFLLSIFKDAKILYGQWPYNYTVLTKNDEEILVAMNPGFLSQILQNDDPKMKRLLVVNPPDAKQFPDHPTWNVLAIYERTLSETDLSQFKRG